MFGGYDWVVPAGVTTARFDVFGGQGAGVGASRGGDGGETAGTIAVKVGLPLVPAKLVCSALVFVAWTYPAQRKLVFVRRPVLKPWMSLS